jgi:hypothetical protein
MLTGYLKTLICLIYKFKLEVMTESVHLGCEKGVKKQLEGSRNKQNPNEYFLLYIYI